jgi:hypothetical protein
MIRQAILCLAACVCITGCRQASRAPGPPMSEPATPDVPAPAPPSEEPPPAPPPTTSETTLSAPGRVVVLVRDPSEPQRGWLIIEEIEKAGQPASAVGTVVGPRKLAVETKNVRALRIDLPRAGMPSSRSIVLRIDHQVIEITGRYGSVARFERSLQGFWYARRKD